MGGCTAAGELDDAQFGRPLPWIGLYVAGASLLCAAAMALDAYSGFRRRRFWFPCRLFSLNAATLTLLGVATKFTVDLNTTMPRRADQLTKLSGTVLICTAMCNFLPSLGAMNDAELLSNVIALAILVVTVVINVGIQMGTGVIYVFMPEHAIIMALMLGILVVLVSSALAVPSIKHSLKQDYDVKNPNGGRSEPDDGSAPLEWLETHVKRHWLLNQTANAQCVLGRWAPCTALGASCFVAAAVLTEALARAFFVRGPHSEFCGGRSDYRWSVILVLVAQAAGVLIGTVSPAYRWVYDGYLRSSSDQTGTDTWLLINKISYYWARRIARWGEFPLPSRLSRLRCLRAAFGFKAAIVIVLILLGMGVLAASNLVVLASTYLMGACLNKIGGRLCTRMKSSSNDNIPNLELEKCVLFLEWERHWGKQLKRWELRNMEEWMENARRKQPTALVELIKAHSTISQGFEQVGAFDSRVNHGASSLFRRFNAEEPPNCWALPVVTLACVAVALPGINQDLLDSLRRGVNEGLRFVRLVELNLEESFVGLQSRAAADGIWLSVNLDRQWVGQDLRSLVPKDNSSTKKILEALARIAEQIVAQMGSLLSNPDVAGDPREWLDYRMVLAANCMYRVCTTILGELDSKHQTDDHRLFVWLRMVISDLLGACLTNLPRVIHMLCRKNYWTIEEGEKSVKAAAVSLMKAKDILQMLQDPQVKRRLPASTERVDDWIGRVQLMEP